MRTFSIYKLVVIFVVLDILAVIWYQFGAPTSIDEAYFLNKVSSLDASGANELKLSELMPGNWEMVCDSHGYDGPFYLEQYKKTFYPVAPPQDGVWGLIFISKDGSYSSAIGSCRVPRALLVANGCIERSQAVLTRSTNHHGCQEFTVKSSLTSQSTGSSKASLLPPDDSQH